MRKSGQEKRTGGKPTRRQVREISDVSQKSRHKSVLWAGDEQVKQLINTSPIAMVVASGIEERVEWVNDKFIELFGYTIEDIPDVEHWWHLAYPDETYRVEIKSQWAAKVEQAIRKKSQIEPMEATVRCKDGSRRYIEFRLSAIGEKHIVTFVDLTERKRVEEELSASEAELRTLINAMTDVIFVGNSEGRYLKIVDTSPSLLYKPSKELLGKTLHEVFPKDLADFFLNHLRQAINTQKSVNFEYSLPIGDKKLWFYATVSPMTGDKTLMVARDITDRKQAEESLRESEEKYRTIFEESFDGLFITSPSGKILDMNRKGVLMYGYDTKEEIQNLDLAKDVYANPADRQRVLEMVNTQGRAEYEVEVKKKNGEIMITHCSLTAVKDETDAVSSYRGVIRDITEEKRAEDILRESEEKYRTLIQKIQAAVIVHGADTQILTSNSMAQELLGLTEDQMLGKTTIDSAWHFFLEDGTAMPLEKYPVNQVLASHKALRNFVVRVHRPNQENNDVWVLVNADPVFGKEDEITQVIVTFIDITERKRAEDELRQNREFTLQFSEQLAALQEVTTELSKVESSDDLCLQAVQLGRSRLGFDRVSVWFIEERLGIMRGSFGTDERGELRDERNAQVKFRHEGLSWLLFSHKESKALVDHCPLYDHLGHKVGEGDNAMAALWDGGEVIGVISVDNLSTGQPIGENQLEVLRLYATTLGHLITRKRAEENLRRSEQKFRALAENIPNVVFQCKNDSRYTFLYLNEAIENLTGYPREDFLENGLSFFDLYHPDDLKTMPTPEENDITDINNNPFHITYRIRHKSGEWRWVDEWGTGVENADGKVEFLQGIMVDITENKQHELEREAIINVSAALRQAATRTDILNVIMDQLIDLFKADGAVLALPDPQTGGFIDEMGRGTVGERMIGLSIPLGAGVCNWVIENKRPYCNNHADHDPLFYRSDLLGDAHCIASVPLIAQEQAIGAVWIARRMDITERELRLLNAIADIAANAVHRIMLHEQTEEQLQHLIALHQIDLAISANFDLNVTLNVFLRNVIDELKVDAASILLLDPITHTLDFAAGIGFRTRKIETSHVKIGTGCAGRAVQEYRTVSCLDLGLVREANVRSSLLADEEFVSHYATPLVIKGQAKGILEIFHRQALESKLEWVDYFETLATQAAIAIESATLFENLQRTNTELILAYDATIEGWSRALDLRDKETEGHTQRVTEMVLELARKMGLSDTEKIDVRRGALLHDIGKMGVPDSILLKPGPLSDSEWEIMRQHPVYAYQMLSPITYLKHALDIPYCHHEKWDGSGYPRKLKGEEIPLSARMFSIVDVFDALTSNRSYRTAWSRETAEQYILEQSGKYFDPRVVEIFLESGHRK